MTTMIQTRIPQKRTTRRGHAGLGPPTRAELAGPAEKQTDQLNPLN